MEPTTTVSYGMTKSIYRASQDYIPAMDGWRRLRDGSMPEQDSILFEVPDTLLLGKTKEVVAEALFVATNAPMDIARSFSVLSRWFADALVARTYRAMGEDYTRAVSVGDTVTVWGQVSLACQKVGWTEIA